MKNISKVSPSLLAADFGNLQTEIEKVNNSNAHWLHLDIMDGVFVPNISFGFPVLNSVKKHCKKPLDVHLMITESARYIDAFHNSGANILTLHYEGAIHLHRSVEQIKKLGMLAGVSLNPHTPVSLLEEIISYVDMVLIMSVNPGFGGQKFIETSYNKISACKELILKKNSNAIIQVDGGVDNTNVQKLVNAGVDVLVSGSYLFGSNNFTTSVDSLIVERQ